MSEFPIEDLVSGKNNLKKSRNKHKRKIAYILALCLFTLIIYTYFQKKFHNKYVKPSDMLINRIELSLHQRTKANAKKERLQGLIVHLSEGNLIGENEYQILSYTVGPDYNSQLVTIYQEDGKNSRMNLTKLLSEAHAYQLQRYRGVLQVQENDTLVYLRDLEFKLK